MTTAEPTATHGIDIVPAEPRPIRRLLTLARPAGPRLALAAFVGCLAALSAVGLTATSAWLISRASQHPPVLTLEVGVRQRSAEREAHVEAVLQAAAYELVEEPRVAQAERRRGHQAHAQGLRGSAVRSWGRERRTGGEQ